MKLQTIKDFYNGKTILITGATGFIGRILLAKLMRMGNIKEILIFSRPKKGKSNEERLDKILSGFLFEEMDKHDKNFRNKLRIITADMEIDGLGISNDDLHYIKMNVEVIIHGAATVRFDEQLRKAVAINIRGTKNMLDIATEARNLQSFVHISTAYSQCPRPDIKEIFYESPIDYRLALSLLQNFDDDLVNAITKKLINPWPNSYTFTKAISEDMIRQYQHRLPIAIIRPSVVQSTYADPVEGYSDTILGILGIAVGVMVGILRVGKVSDESIIDVIPVDFVVNSALALGVRTTESKISDPNIYNCIIGSISNVSFGWFREKLNDVIREYPTKKMVWLPTVTITTSETLFRILYVLYHYLPAFFIDILLYLKGSDIQHTWTFTDGNMKKVIATISKDELKEFPMEGVGEYYEQHYFNTVNGIRKYFLKETDEDLEEARKKYKILKVAHYIFVAIIYSIATYFIMNLFLKYFSPKVPFTTFMIVNDNN